MKAYSKIPKFKNIIETVRSYNYCSYSKTYPPLKFIGTVRIKGVDTSIVKYKNHIKFKSINTELSVENDSEGFMSSFYEKGLDFLSNITFNDYVEVYGKWCDLGRVNNYFIIYAIKVDNEWVELDFNLQDNNLGIYNILQFPNCEIDIDFSKPRLAKKKINKTIDTITKSWVTDTLYAGMYARGMVFTCVSDLNLIFKSKGRKKLNFKI